MKKVRMSRSTPPSSVTLFGDQKFYCGGRVGNGPDAAVQNRHTFLQFAAKGLYQDVTPWVEKSGLKTEDFTSVQLAESSHLGWAYLWVAHVHRCALSLLEQGPFCGSRS